MTILDILLDEKNKDPITLRDSTGRALEFEQIAVIPYMDKIYCVLKPLSKIDNVGDDEAIVFFVNDRCPEPMLEIETNKTILVSVFNAYYNLIEESISKKDEN